MSEAHLVAALTWSQDYDLRARLEELRVQFPVGWRSLDESLFLQVCKGLAGFDMTKTGQIELVKKLKQDLTIIDRAGNGLRLAAEWLSREAAVVNQEVLPYAFQLVLLAIEFDRRKNIVLPRDVLLQWLWGTSWSAAFASATDRQVRSEQERLRSAIDSGQALSWVRSQPLPGRFDFRSARARLLLLRLALRSQLLNVDGSRMDGRMLLVKHGREALVRFFPVPRRATSHLKFLLQGAGNRFLIDPADDVVIRERLQQGPDLSSAVLQSHFVDAESQKALRAGDLETFVSRRAQAIDQWDAADFEAECAASSQSS